MAFFKGPTVEELKPLNEKYGFCSSEEELSSYAEVLKDVIKNFQLVYENPENVPPVKYVRDCGYRPESSENPLNAWYWKTSIKGAPSGKLLGKKVGMKDTVFVAGVPMMNGSRALEGFIPEYDATVVTWMLDQGAEIAGKTTCEDFCCSGQSYLTTYGPVRNPWNPKHSSGGSTSGSAVLVATKEVDFGIGGDQGGSIRIPCSHCGIVGLKPTFGLIPYTGIGSIDCSIDTAGPMARNVKDCAALLEVIAGFDNHNDPRQPTVPYKLPEYVKELEKPVSDLKIGILKEGFEGCKPDVIQVVNKAVDAIKGSSKFSNITDVSATHHAEATGTWKVIFLCSVDQTINGSGVGIGTGGIQSSRLSESIFRGLKTNSHTLSHSMKMCSMFAPYLKEKYGMASYARAQSLIMKHRQLYDKLFDEVDLLLMPTLPLTAPEIPGPDVPIPEQIHTAFAAVKNTAPFNASHQPAITINAGFSEANGLPVGLQLVAQRWKDDVLLRAAHAVEEILTGMQTKSL